MSAKDIFKKVVVAVLTWESRRVLAKYRPKIIGITGSVGKTTTKDAIYTVLAKHFFVRKSEKSYNSEIGIPLTILGCENAWSNPLLWIRNIFKGLTVLLLPTKYPEWLVLEIGLDAPGDIARVVRWLSIDVAVFTQLAKVPVHVEFFDSPEELLIEKKKLLKGLTQDGVLVVNRDDELLHDVVHPAAGRTVTYGYAKDAVVRATRESVMYDRSTMHFPTGMRFTLSHNKKLASVKIADALGSQHTYPFLAAASVGVALGMELADVAEALADHTTGPGRMKLISGAEKTMIIDDSYNSSPIAVREALRVLGSLGARGRKIAVLGDMMELGKFSVDAHKKAGKLARSVCDILITVGPRAKYIAESAVADGMEIQRVIHFNDSEKAGPKIRRMLEEGDIVLVKGSQAVRLEKITKALMAEPERAEELLVRQDKVWLAKA